MKNKINELIKGILSGIAITIVFAVFFLLIVMTTYYLTRIVFNFLEILP